MSSAERARGQSTDAAFNRVLSAEQEARDAVAVCEREAEALVARAEQQCRGIVQRAERRIRNAHAIADRGVEQALARLRPPAGDPDDAYALPAPEAVEAVVETLAAELVGAPPARTSDQGP